MAMSSNRYRREIDGLRAVAILPVVLYHAGIAGFSGGYVGVDVFFVISGFLITSTIQEEIREGQFSLRAFYERRLRRVFPALFFMLGVCTVAAGLTLYPEDYRRFSRSLIAATLFISNFLFESESGYFDGSADEKPLLHTWSLSVEEVFYIVFPLALVFAWRWIGLRWSWIVFIVGLLSFGGSTFALYLDPYSSSVFYLPHYRAWELLLGTLLALMMNRPGYDLQSSNTLTLVGLSMIGAAVFLYSEETPFPGTAALLPCLGAALVIGFGQNSTSVANGFLTNRYITILGLVSYSLYLWHWPVLVLYHHWVGRKPTAWEAGLLIAISLGLAIFSWRCIERPFRGRSGVLSQRTLFIASGAVMVVMVGVGLHGEISGGWVARYDHQLPDDLAARNDRDERQEECLSPKPDPTGCLYGDVKVPPSVVLWGDSHAAVFSVTLGHIAAQRGEAVQAFTMWACPPTPGWQLPRQEWRKACARLQDLAMQTLLRSPNIHSVVLASRFAQISLISDRQLATDAFYTTVDRLLEAGKRVVIVYPVPELDPRLHEALDNNGEETGPRTPVGQRIETFLSQTRDAFEWLDNIGERDNLIRVYPHRLLCDDLRCYAYRDNKGFYYDQQHLSLSGADLFSGLFESVLFTKDLTHLRADQAYE